MTTEKPKSPVAFSLMVGLWLVTFVPLVLFGRGWFVWGTLHFTLLFLLLYPVLCANCDWIGPVINAFRTERKEVWLTIDDGPHPVQTKQILSLLSRFNAKATFFLIGRRALKYPELVRAILQEGHTIGNHSANHLAPIFWAISKKAAIAEIEGGARAIQEVSGYLPPLFRAPVGMANVFVRNTLYERQMGLIGWSVRGGDGVCRNVSKIVNKVLKAIRPGAIVLLHDGHGNNANPAHSVLALESILTHLKKSGYACVIPTIDQLAKNAGSSSRAITDAESFIIPSTVGLAQDTSAQALHSRIKLKC